MKIIRPLTPLRQRMLEDMQIRNYSPHTIDGYLRYVAQFAKHCHTSPDRLSPEHIRTYQLHLLHTHVSESVFIQTVCALRFFYETTLGRPWMVDYIPYPKKPKTLPSSSRATRSTRCYWPHATSSIAPFSPPSMPPAYGSPNSVTSRAPTSTRNAWSFAYAKARGNAIAS
jgi:Phage integrase, N-terminal SAM-like domain